MKRPAVLFALTFLAAGSLTLGACKKLPVAPTTSRVCYHLAFKPDGTWQFNKLAENQKSIEYCAVELERMRLNFLRMGGSNREIVGSYQGHFVFLQEEGVFFSSKFNGVRYLALRRYGGKLIMPGAIVEEKPGA